MSAEGKELAACANDRVLSDKRLHSGTVRGILSKHAAGKS